MAGEKVLVLTVHAGSAESPPQPPSKGGFPGDGAEDRAAVPDLLAEVVKHRVAADGPLDDVAGHRAAVTDLVVESGALVPIHGLLGQEPNPHSGSDSASRCH